MQKHVLYVAWGFPPAKSGGAFRMLATANALVAEGHRITVLACDIADLHRYVGSDTSTMSQIDPAIRIVRIPMPLSLRETDIHRFPRARATSPRSWREKTSKTLEERFPNWLYSLWREPLLEAAHTIHDNDPVDLVISSGEPFVSFCAGLELFNHYRVPYVLDYRDAWSLQQFTHLRTHPYGGAVYAEESQLIGHASEVWFVNEALLEWHEIAYPEMRGKSRVVANGYDEAVISPSATITPRKPGPYRFAFLGTMTVSIPYEACLAGFARFRSHHLQEPPEWRIFGYLGFFSSPDRMLLSAISRTPGVRWEGPVPKSDVADAYAEQDALVLTFGGGRYITSGKVYEYAAACKPIISLHSLEAAACEVLRDYPLWFPADDLSTEGIAAAFEAAYEAIRSGKSTDPAVQQQCREVASRFGRSETLRKALREVAVLSDSVSPPRTRSENLEVEKLPKVTYFSLHDTDPSRRAVLDFLSQQGTWIRYVLPAALYPRHCDDPIPEDRTWDSVLTRQEYAKGQSALLSSAEPGTHNGRMRDLWQHAELLGPAPKPSFSSLSHEWVSASLKITSQDPNVIWIGSIHLLPAAHWVSHSVLGSRLVLDDPTAATTLENMSKEDRQRYGDLIRDALSACSFCIAHPEDAALLQEWGATSVLSPEQSEAILERVQQDVSSVRPRPLRLEPTSAPSPDRTRGIVIPPKPADLKPTQRITNALRWRLAKAIDRLSSTSPLAPAAFVMTPKQRLRYLLVRQIRSLVQRFHNPKD